MSTEFLRRYIDIINEAQELQQLDEGLLDTIKAKVAQMAQKVFSPQDMAAMKQAVEKATGKPIDQVGIRDLMGQNAMEIATALGVKPTTGAAVQEDQVSEILGREDPRLTYMRREREARGIPMDPEAIKTQQDYFDYEKYGMTTNMLVKRIVGFGSQFAGLAGIIGTVFGNVNPMVGLVALIAFLVGSLVAFSGNR